eukprot:SAG25_NODE_6651_length_541_cov_0.701357_1_plen_85_part_10
MPFAAGLISCLLWGVNLRPVKMLKFCSLGCHVTLVVRAPCLRGYNSQYLSRNIPREPAGLTRGANQTGAYQQQFHEWTGLLALLP